MKKICKRLCAAMLAVALVAGNMNISMPYVTAAETETVTREETIQSTEESSCDSENGTEEVLSEETMQDRNSEESVLPTETEAEESTVPVEESMNGTDDIVEATDTIEEVLTEEISEETITEITVVETEAVDVSESTLAYTGTTYTTGSGLAYLKIEADVMLENGMEFNESNLLAIIEARAENVEEVFQGIEFYYGESSTSIYASVWNAAIVLLSGQYSSYEFHIPKGTDGTSERWYFTGPATADKDIVLEATWSAKGAGEGVEIEFENTTFPANYGSAYRLMIPEASEQYSAFGNALLEGTQGALYDSAGKWVYDKTVDIHPSIYMEDGLYAYVWMNVFGLSAGEKYTINRKDYTGEITTSQVGDVYLSIDSNGIQSENFTTEQLVSILKANKDFDFNYITIRVYNETETEAKSLNGAIVNAAAAIMAAPEEGKTNALRIYYNCNSDYFGVYLLNPKGGEAEIDQAIAFDMSVSSNNLLMKANVPSYNADNVAIDRWFKPSSEIGTAITDMWGNDRKTIYVDNTNVTGTYYTNQVEVGFDISHADTLEPDTWYTVVDSLDEYEEDYSYAGKIVTDADGLQTLYMSARDAGKEIFKKGDLEKHLSVYLDKINSGEMEPISHIVIEQLDTTNRIIYKNDYNFLRKLLGDEYQGTTIDYAFEQLYSDDAYDKLHWKFYQPSSAAAKDMVLKVSVNPEGIGGIKVKVPSITYPACESVELYYECPAFSDLASEFDYAAYTEDEDRSEIYLGILSNVSKLELVKSSFADVLAQKEYAPMYRRTNNVNGEDIRIVSFGNVKNLPKTECSLFPLLDVELGYTVGSTVYGLIEMKSPDEGVKPLWKCYTPDTAYLTEKGYLTTYKEGVVAYGVTYVSDGVRTADLWLAEVIKEFWGISFLNASEEEPMEMELPPAEAANSQESRKTLDIRYYPAGMVPAADELEWTVSGNCIELITDEDGNATGEIKALTEGEAKITVTYKKNRYVTESCKVIVKPAVEDEADFASITPTIITNIHKKLGEISLPEGYRWKEPDILISEYSSTPSRYFSVIYEAEDKRTCEGRVKVGLITLDHIDAIAKVQKNGSVDLAAAMLPTVLEDGDILYLSALAGMPDQAGQMDIQSLNTLLEENGDLRRIQLTVTSKTGEELIKTDETVQAWQYNEWKFIADASSKGKKTFNLILKCVDAEKGTVTELKKTTFTATVASGKIIDWDQVLNADNTYREINGVSAKLNDTSAVDESGILVIRQKTDDYVNLTVKSQNAQTCKVKRTTVEPTGDYTYTKVEYEIKNGGRVYLSIKAADETKSSTTISWNAKDINPKVRQNTVSINTNYSDISGRLFWELADGTAIAEGTVIPYTIGNEANSDFTVTAGKTDANGVTTIVVALNNTDVTGKFKLNVNVPVICGEEVFEFETTISVTVSDKTPAFNVKQSKKVNSFYTDEEGNGLLTITSKDGLEVSGVELISADEKNLCGYTLDKLNANEYAVKLSNANLAKNTGGLLRITCDALKESVLVKFKVKTENKAPSILLSQKSDVIYSKYEKEENMYSEIVVSDKKSGVVFEDYVIKVTGTSGIKDVENGGTCTLAGKKNTYILQNDNNCIRFVLTDYENAKKGSDKFSLQIQKENWSTPQKISYSIKIDNAVPKLVLSSKTITLNSHDSFYKTEVGVSKISFKGKSTGLCDRDYRVEFDGMNKASKMLMLEQLDLRWNDEDGMIEVRVNEKGISEGTYKYKVTLASDSYGSFSTQISVKIKAVEPEKCLNVKGKGSIDILNAEATGIEYIPVLKNANGSYTGTGGYLTGPDADMFTVDEENGRLTVRAKSEEGLKYSTKKKYQIIPVFVYENEDGRLFEVDGKGQTIKVKQGKPKVTVSAPDGNILYRDRTNELILEFNSLLNKTINLPIEKVTLANYEDDLDAVYMTDGESGQLKISQKDTVKKMMASGKIWKLKFNVYTKGKAGNEKPIQVSYKIRVE